MLSSAGIALREGVEAALLIAALLAVVARAGTPERKRWVHAGWISAAFAGAATWFVSRYFLEVSGLSREFIEGASALLASSVLFYVSYWLFAKREAARWVSYLRVKASSGATLSLFGIAFLAVYREAFETVIFYQALVAQPGTASAAGVGALLGAVALVGIVVAYGRAGRFAPPQSFFAFSSLLLYALAVVFAGQGFSALQTTGHLPFHPVRLPHLPALGVYSTLETYIAQATLIVLAVGAAITLRSQRDPPAPPGPGRDGMAGSREGAKL
jgi:high-affinity iron transporter